MQGTKSKVKQSGSGLKVVDGIGGKCKKRGGGKSTGRRHFAKEEGDRTSAVIATQQAHKRCLRDATVGCSGVAFQRRQQALDGGEPRD
jgi:hypothetical protein